MELLQILADHLHEAGQDASYHDSKLKHELGVLEASREDGRNELDADIKDLQNRIQFQADRCARATFACRFATHYANNESCLGNAAHRLKLLRYLTAITVLFSLSDPSVQVHDLILPECPVDLSICIQSDIRVYTLNGNYVKNDPYYYYLAPGSCAAQADLIQRIQLCGEELDHLSDEMRADAARFCQAKDDYKAQHGHFPQGDVLVELGNRHGIPAFNEMALLAAPAGHNDNLNVHVDATEERDL